MADPVGVNIAFDDAMLEPDPTWTRLDNTANLIARYDIRRGRTDIRETTGTGTAFIAANDTLGLFDPTNTGSPYFGELDGRQAALALHNPVTDTWSTIFRGFIDDWDSQMDRSQVVTRVGIPLVDGLDFLAGVELFPASPVVFGDTPPAGSDGQIFYAETVGTVDDRIKQALDDAAWPTALRSIFTGNVRLQDTIYSAGQTILNVIDDAAEAEFPGIANRYISKDGIFTFHGRLARFDPTNPDYGITTWQLGDGAAILLDPTVCQIRALGWNRPRKSVINSAFCTPKGIAPIDRAGQLYEDPTSIAAYGRHSWSAEDLVILESVLTGNNALQETLLYSNYYVTTFSDPRTQVNQIAVKAINPDDDRAAAVWAFLCDVELGDIIHLKTTHPGGGGFDDDFYVEGITYTVDPLQPDYQNVTCVLDVTNSGYYTFEWVP